MKAKILYVCLFCLLPLFAKATISVRTVTIDGLMYVLYYGWSSGDESPITAVVVKNEQEKYSGNIVIPETVNATLRKIVDRMYDRTEEYVATFKVQYIDRYAFENCEDLVSVTIPSSIKSIAYSRYNYSGEDVSEVGIGHLDFGDDNTNPFRGCHNLSKIVVDDKNEVFDSRNDCNAIIMKNGDVLVSGCKNTTIPTSVKIIGRYAFSGCSELTTINLPEGLITINGFAFENCNNLKTISFPETLKKIVVKAFKGCSGLSDVYSYSKPELFNWFADYEADLEIEEPVFDESVKETSLHVRDVDIEEFKADENWNVFKEIVPIEIITDFNLTYYVDGKEYKKEQHKYDDEITAEPEPTKKGMTFSGWSEIPEKMLGKDVDVTGSFTWSKETIGGINYQVTDTLNNTLAISSYNASGEIKIVSPIEFDGYKYNVTDIADFTFKNNTDITSVAIPESVRNIGDEAFYGCKNLAKIELGKSVNQIEPRAFAGIDKLTDVTIYAEDVPSTDRTAFENSYIEDYVTLHVPAGSVEKYKAAAPWKNFKEIVAIPDADTDDTDVDVITIKSYGKGTYCSDYDLDFSYTDNLKAFIVTGYDHKTNTIWLTRVKSVPAGTGIIVKGTPGDYKVKRVESLSVYANFLVGTTEDKKIKDVEGEMTNFVLSKGEWYRFDGEITLPQGMAYLPLPLSKFAGTRSLTEVYEDNDEDTTEIRTIEQGIVSSEHDVWFNLQGQRVDKPRKGLYIKNGKKVVIK